MRSFAFGLLILPILALSQTMLAMDFQWDGGRPNPVLVVVLAWNLVRRDASGLLWAFVGGLVLDALSGGPMGSILLALLMVSLIGNLIGGRFWGPHWLLALVYVVVGSILYHLIYLLVLTFCGWPMNLVESLTTITLPSAVLNLVLMIPVYPAMRWLAARIAPAGVSN